MKVSQISSVVPKPVRVAAAIIMGCAILLGPVAAFLHRLAMGVVAGVVIAGWVFFLGYVYGDARRRNMPPILWTLVAALVPNLLGFLFYFAMRKSVAPPCPHCGQALEDGRRFCSWCGQQSPFAPPGLDTSATV
jgi:hypothetical protein